MDGRPAAAACLAVALGAGTARADVWDQGTAVAFFPDGVGFREPSSALSQ
jgi:hypothetical protein